MNNGRISVFCKVANTGVVPTGTTGNSPAFLTPGRDREEASPAAAISFSRPVGTRLFREFERPIKWDAPTNSAQRNKLETLRGANKSMPVRVI
jgi:hypothetical protein